MNTPLHQEHGCWCGHDASHYRSSAVDSTDRRIGCRSCEQPSDLHQLDLQTVSEDRRRHERVSLPQPIRTSIGGAVGHVIDASIGGVGVLHHQRALPEGAHCKLLFHSQFGPIALHCEVSRTAPNQKFGDSMDEKNAWQTGLKIVSAEPESDARLRRLVMALAAERPSRTNGH
jgi:PilZ domain-containing protein